MEPKKKRGNPDKLVRLTTQKAREIGAKGGVKSGEAKREKKLLSQMYTDVVAKNFGLPEGMSLETLVAGILTRFDASSVSMLKEIREATEGSKLRVDGELSTPVPFVFVDPPSKDDASPL